MWFTTQVISCELLWGKQESCCCYMCSAKDLFCWCHYISTTGKSITSGRNLNYRCGWVDILCKEELSLLGRTKIKSILHPRSKKRKTTEHKSAALWSDRFICFKPSSRIHTWPCCINTSSVLKIDALFQGDLTKTLHELICGDPIQSDRWVF